MPAAPSPRSVNNTSSWNWYMPVILSVSSPNEPKLRVFSPNAIQSSRRERGCYNCGNKNHLAENCPKPNNKAFVGVTWSDSEDGDEPQNDATCLMAIDSQKVRRGHDSLKDHRITDNSCTNHNNVHRRPLYSYPLNQDIDIIPISKVINLEEVIHRVENIREVIDHPTDQVIVELYERTLRSHAQDRSNFFAFVSIIEPKNIKEAIKDESWRVAMQEELDQFIRNDVWDLVPCLVVTKTPISRKRVLTLDKDNESIDSTKYRGMIGNDAVVVRDFYKKFYNSLVRVPNRCSSSISKTRGLFSFSRGIGWEDFITV
ncbi:retrovirus-related pol polyprotein from transposon TNT 1-94 [Tanacetum coccineum]|uniref:Retrovirus-related pol polyprotein from transposon TNT 1-94 n=1 Tax=Tanacetum coccineum TaxID=301880 RepID=A0ABQ5I9N7_9ASTR